MIKQQAVERFNNLDLDDLPVTKGKFEKIFWTLLKPIIKKWLLALIDYIFRDKEETKAKIQ